MKINIRNSSFEVDPGPYPELWKYIGDEKWEPETFEIIDRLFPRGGVFVDIGCWAGPITLYAAQKAARVLAIDPDPVAFELLQKNVQLNPSLATRISCLNMAIARENSSITLHARAGYGNSSSSLLPRIRDKVNQHQTKGITLNELLQLEKTEQVDFIKMDIEGGEFDLLPALSEELKRLNHPTLFVSFHYEQLKEHLYLKKIKWRLPSLVLMKLEKWLKIELFGRQCAKHVKRAIAGLIGYDYVYSASGKKLNLQSVLNNPLLIKTGDLLFTNQKWEYI